MGTRLDRFSIDAFVHTTVNGEVPPFKLTRNGRAVLVFTHTEDRTSYVESILRGYAGGDIEIALHWFSDTTGGDVTWRVAFERNDSTLDLATSNFGNYAATATTAPTAGRPKKSLVTIPAVDLGGAVDAEMYRLRVARYTADGGDLGGSCYLRAMMAYNADP